MSEITIKITVAPQNLNNVLGAVRAAGLRHVELDQVDDTYTISMNVLQQDMATVLQVVQGAQRKAPHTATSTLSEFASARPRNRSGQFVPITASRKGSGHHAIKKTGS